MAQTTSERTAAYRSRQRAAGRVSLTLLVPEEDVGMFTELAAHRRARRQPGPKAGGRAAKPTSPAKGSALATAEAMVQAAQAVARPSRADELAQQLLRSMATQGWPVGQVLGSEAELMQRHGVSRPVLRQAIRLLEHQGVATMRRGSGGGLVVRAPDLAATLQAVSLYLDYRGIRPVDVLLLRRTLDLAAVELAIERLDAEGEQALRAAVEADRSLTVDSDSADVQRLHTVIATLAGDPALSLFLQIVLRLTHIHSGFERRSRAERGKVIPRIQRMHRKLADALLARDLATARKLINNYLDSFKLWMG